MLVPEPPVGRCLFRGRPSRGRPFRDRPSREIARLARIPRGHTLDPQSFRADATKPNA